MPLAEQEAVAVGLDNLTLVVVDNRSGSLPMGSIAAKLEPFGWDAVTVDGRDHDALREALSRRSDGPTAVVAVVEQTA